MRMSLGQLRRLLALVERRRRKSYPVVSAEDAAEEIVGMLPPEIELLDVDGLSSDSLTIQAVIFQDELRALLGLPPARGKDEWGRKLRDVHRPPAEFAEPDEDELESMSDFEEMPQQKGQLPKRTRHRMRYDLNPHEWYLSPYEMAEGEAPVREAIHDEMEVVFEELGFRPSKIKSCFDRQGVRTFASVRNVALRDGRPGLGIDIHVYKLHGRDSDEDEDT